MVQNIYVLTFAKSKISFKNFLWKRKREFWHLSRKFFAGSGKIFCSNSQKKWKLKVFPEKWNFHTKCSSWHIECSFDNPAVKFSSKRPNKKSPKVPEELFIWYFSTTNLQCQMFFWTRRMQFRQLCRSILAESPKNFQTIPEIIENLEHFQSIFFPQSFPMNRNFLFLSYDSWVEIFLPSFWVVCSK